MKKVYLALSIISLLFLFVGCSSKDVEEEITYFTWPRSEIAKLLPVPDTNIGINIWENSDGFMLRIDDTSREFFEAYTNECINRGFTVDYTKTDSVYYALNEDGYDLSLIYQELSSNTLSICLKAPEYGEEDSSPEPTETPTASVSTTPDNSADSTTSPSSPGNNYDWKQFLQDYEDWVDSYIEIVEKYNANPTDATLLSDYMNMLSEQIEWAEKTKDLESELSGDDLKDYLEVMTRILQKLSDIE